MHQAKTQPNAMAIYDSTGASLTYREVLVRSIGLANILSPVLGKEDMVGVLLPPSAGAALVNIALELLGKIPVNLNYTASQAQFDHYVRQCHMEQIITSYKVMQRVEISSKATFVAIESLRKKLNLRLKAISFSEAELIPEKWLGAFFRGLESDHGRNRLDETATVIFTAGSTGDPKGVMLSHRNILSNIHAIEQHAKITKKETVLGVVPFFHSFGFTMTLWAVLVLGHTAVYHYSPLDARVIGELCQRYQASVLFCTPTIMRSYIKRVGKDKFNSLHLCILGGEKLRTALRNELQKELNILPLEGFGLTETSPVVACNVPNDVLDVNGRMVPGNRPGTVGLPLPGTAIRIVDIAHGGELPPGGEGMIHVCGPQVMQGYLNKPEETSKVMDGPWFKTGDLGFLDSDGFLTVTGRLSQFSKIGGEMVPHLGVEQAILQVTGALEQDLVVTSAPDEKRGEKLVVVSSKLPYTPREIVKRLTESSVSRLWIPDAGDFIKLDALPVLPSGKIDLQKIKKLVAELKSESGENS